MSDAIWNTDVAKVSAALECAMPIYDTIWNVDSEFPKVCECSISIDVAPSGMVYEGACTCRESCKYVFHGTNVYFVLHYIKNISLATIIFINDYSIGAFI